MSTDVKVVGSEIVGLANDIDSLTSKLETSATEVETQLHEAGQALYGVKMVFYFGILAILAVGIASTLAGGALLAVAKVLFISNAASR
jgi:hypothetical protein